MPSVSIGTIIPSEDELRVRKKTNVIIFNLLESNPSESAEETEMKVLSLFHDLDIPITDIKSMFRVGRPSAVRTRPVVIKLTSANTKRELLLKAKNLKGNASWNGLVITHDLTKMQCLEEKNFVNYNCDVKPR